MNPILPHIPTSLLITGQAWAILRSVQFVFVLSPGYCCSHRPNIPAFYPPMGIIGFVRGYMTPGAVPAIVNRGGGGATLEALPQKNLKSNHTLRCDFLAPQQSLSFFRHYDGYLWYRRGNLLARESFWLIWTRVCGSMGGRNVWY
jgi:hypothetical protein